MSTPEHSIAALCQRSRDISLEKGWLNEDGTDPRPFYTVTSLFHTELSEAFEDIRSNKKIDEIYYEDKKPCGVPVELADFVIRVAQYYGSAKLGEKLQSTMADIAIEERDAGGEIADEAEQLITDLHASASLAWLASKGRHPVGDPLHHHAVATVTVFAFCRKHGIDIWAAIDEKEAYNRTRPIKHGGKKM